MRKEGGKFLWWDIKDGKADVIDIQATEMYGMARGREGDYPAVGHKEWVHIAKGVAPQNCGPSKDECPCCRMGQKATMQFRTIVFAFDAPGSKSQYGGGEFVTTFGATLAKKLGEQQKMLRALGFTDEEILSVRYRVTRAPGVPYSTWDVTPAAPPVKGAKPIPRTMAIEPPRFDRPPVAAPVAAPAPVVAPAAPGLALDLNLIAPVPPKAPEAPVAPVTFSPAELTTVRNLNGVIQARLDENSALYDPSFGPKAKPSIEATLRANKISEAKIAAVMATVDDKCVIHDEQLGVATAA